MPSTTENLGFVVLEAMSAGCPVVAARAGGSPDLVRHEENGLLYDPERPAEAVGAVRAPVGSRGMRRPYAAQGRKAAEESSWQQVTQRLVERYRIALAIHQPWGALGRLARVGRAADPTVAIARRPACAQNGSGGAGLSA